MTLPIDWLDAVVTAAKAAGRDFDYHPLTGIEQGVLVLQSASWTPERAAEYLVRNVRRRERPTIYRDPSETTGDAA